MTTALPIDSALLAVTTAPATPTPHIVRDDLGYSVLSAREWSRAAGVEPAVGVLAVLIASEAPRIDTYPAYGWAIGEACINAAADIRWLHPAPPAMRESLEDALVRRIVGDKREHLDGRFGPQPGRWASTRQQPHGQHMRMAGLLIELANRMPEYEGALARGATQWVDQKTQVIRNRAKPESNPTPEDLMRRRYGQRQRWVGQDERIDPWILTLLGPRGVDETAAMVMLADGRRRWKQPA